MHPPRLFCTLPVPLDPHPVSHPSLLLHHVQIPPTSLLHHHFTSLHQTPSTMNHYQSCGDSSTVDGGSRPPTRRKKRCSRAAVDKSCVRKTSPVEPSLIFARRCPLSMLWDWDCRNYRTMEGLSGAQVQHQCTRPLRLEQSRRHCLVYFRLGRKSQDPRR